MRVALTGGTGYIGRHVVRALVGRGDTCVVVSRSGKDPWDDLRVEIVQGDPTSPGPWQRAIAEADMVVNLAGARLVDPPGRWTARRKGVLHTSRVDTTRHVASAIRDAPRPPRAFLSASAIGYYGPRGDDLVDESEPPGDDFLGWMCADWEQAALVARDATRVVTLRTGLVVGRGAPLLAPMLPFFKLGLGASWGSGREWVSWIHIADEVGLMCRLLDHHEAAGAFNLTAANPVTVDDFVNALGDALNRPVWLRVPAFALRIGLGEAADALLNLQRVIPKRAQEVGYAFRYTEIDGALRDIFAGARDAE